MKDQIPFSNTQIANTLRAIADQLTDQQANPFRINAYRNAATTIDALQQQVANLVDAEGMDHALETLEVLPGIGQRLASTIVEIAQTGTCAMLDRLRGKSDPEQLFLQVPTIGPVLAKSIYHTLHIETLADLEQAAHDGRLASVPGIGQRRIAAIKLSLASLLRRTNRPMPRSTHQPSAADLLHLDQEYRARARAKRLPTIAPKRFNPERDAWLPIWHTQHNGWSYTLLFSNTARAHELEKTQDWVVAYYEDELHLEGQATIVTEYQGPLAGLRVVRGREQECGAYYQTINPAHGESNILS